MNTKLDEAKKTAAAAVLAAKSAQDAVAALEVEVEVKAQELSEVWYLWDGGTNGWHFADDAKSGEVWDRKGTETLSMRRRNSLDDSAVASIVTRAVHDNARALYHGADFVGRLDLVDVPVCELNKATRDEMFALPFDLFDGAGYDVVGVGPCASGGTLGEHLSDCPKSMSSTYRLRKPAQDAADKAAEFLGLLWAERMTDEQVAAIIRKAYAKAGQS